jgi:hypothetical protein
MNDRQLVNLIVIKDKQLVNPFVMKDRQLVNPIVMNVRQLVNPIIMNNRQLKIFHYEVHNEAPSPAVKTYISLLGTGADRWFSSKYLLKSPCCCFFVLLILFRNVSPPPPCRYVGGFSPQWWEKPRF